MTMMMADSLAQETSSHNLPFRYIGVDIGSKIDRSAIAVLDQRSNQIVTLTALPVGSPYTQITTELQPLTVTHDYVLGVDSNGAGAVIAEILLQQGVNCLPIFTTGGRGITKTIHGINAAKTDLVFLLKAALAGGLTLSNECIDHALELRQELASFIRTAGSRGMKFGAVSSQHDDLIMAIIYALVTRHVHLKRRVRGLAR